MNSRVNIYRNTSFYDGKHHPAQGDADPAWAEVLNRLKGVYDPHRDDSSSAAFEQEGLALLWPCLEARLQQNRGRGGPPSERPYECWTYDYRREDRLNLHIANVYRPRSPLGDLHIPFAASLIRLLRDSRERRPGVEVVRCGSWLNSMPPFLALFPEQWAQSAQSATEVRYTMGHWGQLTDRRGGFHVRNGERFRTSGEFPFPCLGCECSIVETLGHLEAHFPEAMDYINTA